MNPNRKRLAITQAVVLLAAACAATNVDLPAITEAPTGERHNGRIVWHDLLTNDPAASRRFYGGLFGWEFENAGSRADSVYTLIRHNGRLIGGMVDTVALNGKDDISQWVALMSVDDIDATVARFESEGGTVLTPPTDLRRRGRLAVVTDAQGALLGLLQARDGDPADREPDIGGFLWDELWASDVAQATEFYEDVAGLEARDRDVDGDGRTGAEYRTLHAGGRPRAGILPMPLEGLDPVWVSYIRVEDPAAITERVRELGGRVIVDAQDRPLGGRVAFVAGPSGAGIALQTWPPE